MSHWDQDRGKLTLGYLPAQVLRVKPGKGRNVVPRLKREGSIAGATVGRQVRAP